MLSNDITNDSTIFSQRLRKERKRSGLTNEQLAEKAYISVDTLESYTRSKPSIPSLSIAAQIAEALHVSLDYLCGVSEVKEIVPTPNASASVILMNLYTATRAAYMELKLDPDTQIVTFTSSDLDTFLFFKQAICCGSESEVRDLSMRFDNAKFFNDPELRKQNYVFRDITNEDMELYPEETQDLIDARKKEVNL